MDGDELCRGKKSGSMILGVTSASDIYMRVGLSLAWHNRGYRASPHRTLNNKLPYCQTVKMSEERKKDISQPTKTTNVP